MNNPNIRKAIKPNAMSKQIDVAYKEYDKEQESQRSDTEYLVGLELTCLTGRYEGVTAVRIPVDDFRERLPLRRIEAKLAKACGIDLTIGDRLFETQMRGNRSFGGKFIVFQVLYPE